MGFYILMALVWFLGAFFTLLITWDDNKRSRWDTARKDYEKRPDELNKKYLAKTAEVYVEQRRRAHLIWIWPISLPFFILWLLAKAPRRLYHYIRNAESDYAQARMHMKGEVK